MNRIIATLIFLLLFQIPALSEAAVGYVYVEPKGNGVFNVNCSNFVNINGVEVTLQYDANALANPVITQGDKLSSTYFLPNTDFDKVKHDKIRFVAGSASNINCTSPGTLATLKFNLKGKSQGVVTVTNKVLSVNVATVGSGSGSDSGSSGSGGSSGGSGGFSVGSGSGGSGTATRPPDPGFIPGSVVTGGGGISVGSITLPQDQLASGETKPEYQPLVTDLRKDMSIPVGGSESRQAVDAKQSASDKKGEKVFVSHKSVLQLFKEFKGERNSKSLIALFADADIADFSQVPTVAISDGKTPVKLTLLHKPSGNGSPKFFVQGANVKQLSAEGEEVKWIIDVLPKKGTSEAKLTVIDGDKMMEFPLIVAPAIDLALAKKEKLSEADFAVYLAKPSKFDLNKDTKFDAIDDYIYTANYIVAMKIKPEKLKADDKEKEKKDKLKPEPIDKPAVKALPARESEKKPNTDKKGKK